MTGPVINLPDTNTILRYLLGDHPDLYKKADILFEKVRTGDEKALILESVLVECVYVLQKFYNVPRDDISLKLKEFLLYKGIINDDRQDLLKALDIYTARNIDIVDSILCAKAHLQGMKVFSFDKDLKKC